MPHRSVERRLNAFRALYLVDHRLAQPERCAGWGAGQAVDVAAGAPWLGCQWSVAASIHPPEACGAGSRLRGQFVRPRVAPQSPPGFDPVDCGLESLRLSLPALTGIVWCPRTTWNLEMAVDRRIR